MDIVRNSINELGGKLRIRYADGEYCEFTVWLPEVENQTIDREFADALNDRG